jgi:hypothetical protein
MLGSAMKHRLGLLPDGSQLLLLKQYEEEEENIFFSFRVGYLKKLKK